MNPCLILDSTCSIKSPDHLHNLEISAESFSVHRSTLAAPILPKPLTYLRSLVRIDCTASNLIPTSLAMLSRTRLLSNITRVCTALTFSSVVASLGRPDRPSFSTPSPHLKLCCPFFHCTIMRLLPKGFHEVFMNFLGRHSFLTEALDNRSDFKLLHFEVCHALHS